MPPKKLQQFVESKEQFESSNYTAAYYTTEHIEIFF